MAEKIILQRSPKPFTTALASAFLEWMLLCMLILDAIFGYLITRFARHCKLPVPCLLCSRLDHILGGEKVGFYWELICGNHKSEISSLVFCSFHKKLVDVHGLCESCLFSFATKDKSNTETYQLLVGKLGAEDNIGVDDIQSGNDRKSVSPATKRCCCCNELWTSRLHPRALLGFNSIGLGSADLDAPFSNLEWNDGTDEMKKPHGLVSMPNVETKPDGSLSNFRYTKLKLSSDTESDALTSDNEDTKGLISNDPLRDLIEDSPQIEPSSATPGDNLSFKRTVDRDGLSHESSESIGQVPSEPMRSHVGPAFGHGLEELNWEHVGSKADPSLATESTRIDVVLESSDARNVSIDLSKDGVSHEEFPSSDSYGSVIVDVKEILTEETSQNHDIGTEQTTADKKASNVTSDPSNSVLKTPNYLDLGDAYKLAVSNKLPEKDSNKVSEELKILLSQLSRGLELLPNDLISPRVSGSLDQIGIQFLQKRRSLERNDSRISLDRNKSGFESLDLSTVSEIDGETEVDRLKRQLEHDRRLMGVLCKDLEEERSASAVAANQAMAMITKLQEEKAALQMEASHDLRMMEEQAEYDIEALEKLNEILSEKEKEMQNLEAEVEFYRTKYPNEFQSENLPNSDPDQNFAEDHFNEASLKKNEFYQTKYPNEFLSENLANSDPDANYLEGQTGEASLRKNDMGLSDTWLDYEDEKLYISNRLNKLEKKLHMFSNTGLLSDSNEMEQNDVNRENRRSLVRRVHSFKNPKGSVVQKEADMVTLGYEVYNLNERLQVLEADRSFIEHATNSLKIGGEGLHFIKQIASDLRELRGIGIRRKQVSL